MVNRSVLAFASMLLLLARVSDAYVCSPGAGATNIAPTGTATASSNPGTAGNAIDGNTSTGWSAAPGTTSAVFTRRDRQWRGWLPERTRGLRNLRRSAHGDRDGCLRRWDTRLDLTGWTLVAATGVSASGRTIVGWGTNPSGQTEGFVATLAQGAAPVPNLGPRATALAGLLLAALALRRRGNPNGSASPYNSES